MQSGKIDRVKKRLKEKLADLPKSPGVYFHKDAAGEIIYIGKAANLRARVRQYFQKSRFRDPKTDILVAEIADIDWTEVETEADALFLEAELVRRYQPRFNILLRDDKSSLYVRINYKSDYPTVTLIRRPLDDGAVYFGPYINSLAIKKALRYLRRAFPYAVSKPNGAKRPSLHYHLGLDPGLEDGGKTKLREYRTNLKKLMQYLKGERVALTRQIERDMKNAAKARDFEKAAHLRNQLFALQALGRQILFSDRELADMNRDEALVQLAKLLCLKDPPRRIEGFDISHMQGSDTVASMVVFIGGVPDKTAYRKFKMRLPGNDDFAHMAETLTRRFREENRRKWGVPDLILIDGGKGQLGAALKVLEDSGISIPAIGLAKKEEEIIIHNFKSLPGGRIDDVIEKSAVLKAYTSRSPDFTSILLPGQSPVVKLLQRIRDESHRFAVSYHTVLKRGRVVSSLLDEVPGIGPQTRKKLIRSFGSTRGVLNASEADLQAVLGPKKGQLLAGYLSGLR